jgi:photosystem II stability/assembly factor-like uncharacterized protein
MPIDYRRLFLRAGALVASAVAGAGCLPDPTIIVPDFSAPPPMDMGVPPADLSHATPMDGPGADLLPSLKWAPDGAAVATDTVRAVWVADPALNQAFAVGQNGLILHRSGGVWTKEQAKDNGGKVITTNLYAVTAATPDTVYAVGEAGVILRRAGGTWTMEGSELMTTVALFGAAVVDTGEVVVVGDGGLIARRQTTGIYVAEDTSALPGASFRAVAGGSLDKLVAVGMGGVIADRTGGKWQTDPGPIGATDNVNFYAISMGADGVFVAGEYGRVLRRDMTGWLREATLAPTPPAITHFYGLSNPAAGELFAVGSGGVVQRRDAKTQMWTLEGSGVSGDLYGVSGMALDSAVAVGVMGTVLKHL